MEHFTLDSFSVGPPSLGHLHFFYLWQKTLNMIYPQYSHVYGS